ncbi:Pex19 Peroxisomal biogenesis factor 19 [Candida maltosa Xu316]|uniref:Peroxisomal (Biogenesis) protein, putative n=1 Tax=Candida maltosa (strain Xu316) TaxID=1245528 RepID=M3K0F5_CANMX|nr:Peroxisomal (Biogenesis) protein, putative [Candida maltosa Xu316]
MSSEKEIKAEETTTAPVTEEKPTTVDEPKKTTTTTSNEDDVDDLDDLLDDFADDVLSKPPGASINNSDTQSAKNDTVKSATNPLDADFKQSINDLIKDLNIEDPETQKEFENLVKEFETNHRETVEAEEKKTSGNFENVMKETMERLKKSGEDIDAKIKNDPLSSNPEDLLTQLLAGMEGINGGDMDMSKLLVDMLEQLSSKEVLYEPIKDLNTKFPDYLKENKDKLDEEKYKNYTQQYDITNDIIKIFESESYSDDNKEQREQVNALLESLQELGQPPTELVGESGDFLPGLGGKGAAPGFDFNDKDLPPDFEKNLQEGCQQQ